MSLLSLPNELLEQVCQYSSGFVWHERAQITTLHSLTVSCKALYTICKPYLYSRVQTGTCDMFCFFRTISADANIAALVKEFSISSLGDYDLGKAYTKLHRELPKSCTRYLHPAKKPAMDLLLLEAIMLRLHNLEELCLCVTSVSESATFFDSRRWRARNLPETQVLPMLKKFIVFARDEERHILSQVQKLLPGQTDLHVELESSLSLISLDVDCLLTIENLDLMIEGISEDNFDWLMTSLPNLKRLEYHGGDTEEFDDWDDEEEVLRFESMIDTLRSLNKAESLTSLGVHFYQPEDFDEIVDVRDLMPDLTDFVKLSYLGLDFAALLDPKSMDDTYRAGTDISDDASSSDSASVFAEHIAKRTNFLSRLPPSLEKLSIFKSDGRVIKELRELAKREEHDFPKLKTLDMVYYQGHDERLEKAYDAMLSEFKEAHIEVVERL